MPKGFPLSKEQISRIRNDYKKGLSITKIGKKIKVNPTSVYNYTKDIKEAKKIKELKMLKQCLNKLSQFQIGYFIGLIDGEGCISIGEHKTTNTKPHFFCSLEVTNSNIGIIKEINSYFPANIRLRKMGEEDKKKNWKDVFNYKVYDKRNLKLLLEFLKPYSKAKKKQLEIVLKFISDDKNKQVKYYNQIKKLNKRGRIK